MDRRGSTPRDSISKETHTTRTHPPQLRKKLQSALVERFHLTFHTEPKEMPFYALVVARNGHKLLSPKNPSGPSAVDFRNGRTQVIGTNAPMTELADALSERFQRSVIDRTGIAGNFDFKLVFTPDESLARFGEDNVSVDPEGASIFAAIQEQLGLKLEGSKGPVEIMVIDRAAKPAEN